MLILTRKLGESITIGDNIKVTVLGIYGRQVRLGIEAPLKVVVHREEFDRLHSYGRCCLPVASPKRFGDSCRRANLCSDLQCGHYPDEGIH